jgi:hypothetical protein
LTLVSALLALWKCWPKAQTVAVLAVKPVSISTAATSQQQKAKCCTYDSWSEDKFGTHSHWRNTTALPQSLGAWSVEWSSDRGWGRHSHVTLAGYRHEDCRVSYLQRSAAGEGVGDDDEEYRAHRRRQRKLRGSPVRRQSLGIQTLLYEIRLCFTYKRRFSTSLSTLVLDLDASFLSSRLACTTNTTNENNSNENAARAACTCSVRYDSSSDLSSE